MPKRLRLEEHLISAEYPIVEGLYAKLKLDPDSLNNDDLNLIAENAEVVVKLIRTPPIHALIQDANFISLADKIVPRSDTDMVEEPLTEELLEFALVAEIVIAIHSTEDLQKLQTIGAFLDLQGNKDLEFMHVARTAIHRRTIVVKTRSEERVYKMPFYERQEYIASPESLCSELAKDLQRKILEDRNTNSYSAFNVLQLQNEYLRLWHELISLDTQKIFTLDYSLIIDRLPRAFGAYLSYRKRQLRELPRLLAHSVDNTQQDMSEIFAFYNLMLTCTCPSQNYLEVIKLLMQINANYLALINSAIFPPKRQFSLFPRPVPMLFSTSEEKLDAASINDILNNMVTSIIHSASPHEEAVTCKELQIFVNSLCKFTAVALRILELLRPSANKAPRSFEETTEIIKEFIDHFLAMNEALNIISAPHTSPTYFALIKLMLNITIKVLPDLICTSTLNVTLDKFMRLVILLDRLLPGLDGENLRKCLRAKLILEKRCIHLMANTEIHVFQDDEEDSNKKELVPVNQLENWIKKKSAECNALISYETAANSIDANDQNETLVKDHKPGILSFGRSVINLKIKQAYYVSLLEYATEVSLSCRVSCLRI